VISIIAPSHNHAIDPSLAVEDFIFHPPSDTELKARVNRALWKNGSWDSTQIIRVGDLTIDQERYDITVDGRRVILTFKEYQLLCHLATNEGRVHTREQLLRRIWGYDYFGGTRTVDVHIRRLRSKLEDAGHLFIETVRNVGYRFRIH
jgi:two-component system alkaline phosphatase synthesis response regulator PhoP